jgi:hypothetical protein
LDGLLLSFGIGASIFGTAVLLYLKKVQSRMRRFVLRYEEIMTKVD